MSRRKPDPPSRAESAVRRVSAEQLLHDLAIHQEELENQKDELQKRNAELERSRDRYHELYDRAPVGYVTLDRGGVVRELNLRATELLACERASALGRPLAAFMCEREADALQVHLREVFSSEDRRICDLVLGTAPGRDIRARLESIVFDEPSEHGKCCHTALIDLTEIRRAEEGLRDAEERATAFAHNIDDAFVVHERDGQRISYANPAFEAIWGRSASTLHRSPSAWIDWLHPSDRDRVLDVYERYLGQGAPLDLEFRVLRPDGEVRWLHARMFPIVQADGSTKRDVAVIQDITLRRELEEQLRQAQKMQAVGALASGVAHDFNNVLQAVLGCLNVVRDRNTSPERAREYLDRAADAARAGGHLSSQLMTFARKEPTQPRPIALDAVIRRTERLLQRLITERIELVVDTRAPNRAMRADPVQIEQILLNLAANARDAMPAGGTLRIRTDEVVPSQPEAWAAGLAPAKTLLRLVVEDDGAGMEDAVRERIFEPFFTTKPVGQGTGIGLATVFAITRELGGLVDVDSAPGEGTRFTFRFPCEGELAETPSQRPTRHAVLSGTVLLVEDEPLVRLTVRHHLEQLGLEVIEAETPSAARRIAEEEPDKPRFLVSDFVLPEMNGARLASLLRERIPELRVLFISANPELLSDADLPTAGTRVLRKPFEQHELGLELAALARVELDPSPRTVLLVEDEPVARLALTELLMARGYRVLSASRPSAALRTSAEHLGPIDLLLSDMHLPEMSGEALAATLRRERPELAVVFMSGQSQPPPNDVPFVLKPVDFDHLEQVLALALE